MGLDTDHVEWQDTTMPSEPDYTLAELASLADVPPRTIRYYVAQGLLPSPEAAGPATRYPAGALARLRLVRQLQRQHLPLGEIRRRLAALTDEEAMELAAAPAEPAPGSALDYVRSLLAPAPPAPALPTPAPPTPEPPALEPPPRRRSAPLLRRQLSADERAVPLASLAIEPPASLERIAPPPLPTPTPERSQWERITLEPDVELHIRRPLSRIANKRVDRLVAFARQLLEEDQP
jgi:DNA-binding transcriptional MerR regulator